MKRFYHNDDGYFVEERAPNDLLGDLVTRPLRHHVYHSPTGMSHGYNGSGPSDLARSILLDCGFPAENVDDIYVEFKWAFTNNWRDGWELRGEDVYAWFVGHQLLVKIADPA